MASPVPKPVEQKIREGNPGRRPLPEPVLIAGRPALREWDEPPDHLPDEGKEFWLDVVANMIEVGVVDRVDKPVLEMLATQYARWRQAQRVVAKFGHFTRGSVGQLREHPGVKIEREAGAAFLRMAVEFGLTPSGRIRLGLAELTRRTLAAELNDVFGQPTLRPIDAVDAVDDADDVLDGTVDE